VIGLTRQILFGESKTEELEAAFVSLVFMCCRSLFKMPLKPNCKLVVSGNDLVLVDQQAAMNVKGPCAVPPGARDFDPGWAPAKGDAQLTDRLKAFCESAPGAPDVPAAGGGKPADFKALNQLLKEAYSLKDSRGKEVDQPCVMDIPFEDVL
jgi:hypothetical protein